jgi:hypothetical protein
VATTPRRPPAKKLRNSLKPCRRDRPKMRTTFDSCALPPRDDPSSATRPACLQAPNNCGQPLELQQLGISLMQSFIDQPYPKHQRHNRHNSRAETKPSSHSQAEPKGNSTTGERTQETDSTANASNVGSTSEQKVNHPSGHAHQNMPQHDLEDRLWSDDATQHAAHMPNYLVTWKDFHVNGILRAKLGNHFQWNVRLKPPLAAP